jgi:hypothetical protein
VNILIVQRGPIPAESFDAIDVHVFGGTFRSGETRRETAETYSTTGLGAALTVGITVSEDRWGKHSGARQLQRILN